MLKKLFVSILILCFIGGIFSLGIVNAQGLEDLIYLTEQYPPYNYEEDGELKGIKVEILQEIFERKNIDVDIELVPWAQGYQRIQNEEDVVLFGMSRTEAREEMFEFAGNTVTYKQALIVLEDSDIVVESLDDLDDYTIGTVRDDVAEAELINAGVSERILDRSGNINSNVEKLVHGRIDIASYAEGVFLWEAGRLGYDADMFKTVYVIDQYESFYAFNLEIPEETIEEFQEIFDELEEEGIVEDIISNYIN